MRISKGDYFLAQIGPKVQLCQVILADSESKRFKAVLEYMEGDKRVPFDLSEKEVLVNFGRTPRVGSAYGVYVEPKREQVVNDYWGDIHIFQSVDDKQRKTLLKAFTAVGDKLAAKKLPELPLTVEVRNQHGSMVGFYKYRPKADTDVLCVKPDPTLESFDYMLAHEYAHGLWARHVTPKMQMVWTKLYHDSMVLSKVKSDELKVMLKDLMESEDLYSYLKGLPEDEAPKVGAVLRHIKQVHNMDKRQIQLALSLGEDISEWWPERIELSEKTVVISKYGMKSLEELFSEAMAFSFVGKKLPKALDAALTKTLSRLK